MDNLRGMLLVRKNNRMRNGEIRELCHVKKGVNKVLNQNVLG